MSHIVIDARESGTSTGRYIDKLIENLQKLDHINRYTVLYKRHRCKTGLVYQENFSELECNVKEFTFSEQFMLLRILNNLHPDLVHFGMVQQPVFYNGRSVTTMHDLTTLRFVNPSKNLIVFKFKQFVYAYVNKKAVKKSSCVITPTEYVKNDVAQYSHADVSKIYVTHEAADKISDKPETVESLRNKKFLMYVGRPQPHKNLERLMLAVKQLKADFPDLILALVGKKDSLYEAIEKRADMLGLSDSVIFTGFVSEGNLRWLYENCAAYVFPSLSEGFGLPGLEAMMHGAPVVSSNTTCLPEVYGNAAYYFDPYSVNEMATKIAEVLTNQKLRAKLIKAGAAQADKYSWRRMAQQTLEVYKKALEE